MNILVYVLALLMAISIMTYARLQTFLNIATIRIEYACYMKEHDRLVMNDMQTKQYEKHHGEGKEHDGEGKKTQARRKISFILFVDQTLRGENDSAHKTFDIITRKMLYNFYHNEPFFQKVQESHGDPVNALITSLMKVADNREGKEVVRNLGDLKTLDLEDPELQVLFAKMLDGADEYKNAPSCPQPKRKGYPRLLDYIEIIKRKDGTVYPIRIQHAPRGIIEAIFDDPNIVEEILVRRDELGKSAGELESPEQQVATQEFESSFKRHLPGNLDQNMFDFTISQTK